MNPYHEERTIEASRTSEFYLPQAHVVTIEHHTADSWPGRPPVSREQARSPYLSGAGPRKMTEPPILSVSLNEISAEASSTPAPPQDSLPFPSSTDVWEPSFLSPPPRSPWLGSTTSISSDVALQPTAGSAVSYTSRSEVTSLPLYHTPTALATDRINNNNMSAIGGARELWRDAKWLISLLIDIVAMIAQVFQAFRSPVTG